MVVITNIEYLVGDFARFEFEGLKADKNRLENISKNKLRPAASLSSGTVENCTDMSNRQKRGQNLEVECNGNG